MHTLLDTLCTAMHIRPTTTSNNHISFATMTSVPEREMAAATAAAHGVTDATMIGTEGADGRTPENRGGEARVST